MCKFRVHSTRPAGQKGVVLVVALVMLLLITMMGITSVKTLTLEERMTINSIDRNAVFQVSEWGLSLAEELAETQAKLCNSGFDNQGAPATTTLPSTCTPTTCQNGLCGYPQPNCPMRWEDSSFTGWATLKNPDKPSENIGTPMGVTPQYIIEYLDDKLPDCLSSPSEPLRYRITVRTQAGEGRARVTLQSISSVTVNAGLADRKRFSWREIVR